MKSTVTKSSRSALSAAFASDSDSDNENDAVEVETGSDKELELTLSGTGTSSGASGQSAAKKQKEMTPRQKCCEKVEESLAVYEKMLPSLKKTVLTSKDLNQLIIKEYPGKLSVTTGTGTVFLVCYTVNQFMPKCSLHNSEH